MTKSSLASEDGHSPKAETQKLPDVIGADGVIYRCTATFGKAPPVKHEDYVMLHWSDGAITTCDQALRMVGCAHLARRR